MNPLIETLESIDVLEREVLNNEIVLFNDDVNTFDHVIETLILVCSHTAEQAEQCAILVHYKGKCTVKRVLTKNSNPNVVLYYKRD